MMAEFELLQRKTELSIFDCFSKAIPRFAYTISKLNFSSTVHHGFPSASADYRVKI